MKKILFFFITLFSISFSYGFDSIYKFDKIDYSLTNVDIAVQQAEKVAKAAFLIEELLAKPGIGFTREDVVTTLEDLVSQERYATNPSLIALKGVINYQKEGVILRYGSGAEELVGGLPVAGTLGIQNVSDMLDCEDQAAAGFDCSYRDVVMLSSIELLHETLADDRHTCLATLDNDEPLGCLSDTSIIGVHRRTTRQNYAQTYHNLPDLKVQKTFMLQILPLNEMAYGSHGPRPYACQSIARNWEEIDVDVDLKKILIYD